MRGSRGKPRDTKPLVGPAVVAGSERTKEVPMASGMPDSLEQACNSFAAQAGLRTVQEVVNRAGMAKPERGKVLPFAPRLYWIEKEKE